MASNGSSVVMPLLFGSVGALVGVGAVFWVVGAVVGLGSPLAWTFGPSHEHADPRCELHAELELLSALPCKVVDSLERLAVLLIIVLLPLLLGTLATLWLGSRSRLLTALAAGLVTLTSLLLLVSHAPTVMAGGVVMNSWQWVPEIGLNLVFKLDGLSMMFAGLILFIGLLIGGAVPFLFSALAIRAVGRTAGVVVQEVRKQFADGKIMKGEKLPEYGPVIDICTEASLRELATPALLAVLTPVVI
eukprot:gene29828-51881_t